MKIIMYTLGIVGTLIGLAMYDSMAKRIHTLSIVREKEAQERSYLNTYGALPEEINRKISDSENLKRLEKLILSLPYLPYELNIDETKIYWFIIDDNGKHLTREISYEDNGIRIIPRECIKTLAINLANQESIKSKYKYCEDCSDWGDRYFLSLRQEYRKKTYSW